MRRLIAVPLAGPAFVDALRRAWDAGDAVLPVDPRLPTESMRALLDEIRPTHIVEAGRRTRRPDGRPTEHGDAIVLATSGTTASPKGVAITHAAVDAAAHMTNARLGVEPARDRWLCCLPVSHAGGLGVITRALRSGTPLDVHERFDADAVDASAATLTSLVATTLARIDPTRWRAIVLGGSTPPPHRPPNVLATYGLTETFGGVVYEGLPLDGVEVRTNPVGLVEIRSPTLLRCYRTPDGDVDPVDADGWFTTGDAGTVDALTGVVKVLGRNDDVIITGGEKVWPDALEQVLRRVDGVDDVCVVGAPDPIWGERVVAVIIASPPGGASAEQLVERLVDAARAGGPAWWAPKQVVVVAALPRTALGKVQRRVVRAQVAGSPPTPPAGSEPA